MESEHLIVETAIKVIDAEINPVSITDWRIIQPKCTDVVIQILGPVNAPPPAAEPKESALYVIVDRDGNLRARTRRNPGFLFAIEDARHYCEQDCCGPHSIVPLGFFLDEIRNLQVSKLIAARFAAEQAKGAQ